MRQRRWLSIACLLVSACQGASAHDVAAHAASLHGGHEHLPFHKRRHHHLVCREDTPPSAACGWQTYSTGLSGTPTNWVFFDPRARGVAYAHGGGFLWRSTDGGETWPQRVEVGAAIVDIAPDGADPNDLIGASINGIVASNDAGASWQSVALQGVVVDALEVAASEPLRMYGTIELTGMLTTLDRGVHWSAPSTNYPRGKTFALSADPRDPRQLLSSLLYLAPDSTQSLEQGGILRTTDGGVSWHAVYEPGFPIFAMERCPTNPDIVIAGTLRGVARSTDNGATWSLSRIDPNPDGVHALAIDPHDCDDFYALQANAGPLHTRDGGQSFSLPLMQGLDVLKTGDYPGTMTIDPEDSSHLILGEHGGFFASHDRGDHWAPIPSMTHMIVTGLGVSSRAPARAWLVTWGQGAWTRESAADPWTRVSVTRAPREYFSGISFDERLGRVLLGANGPLLSQDGQTFRELPVHGLTFDAAFDPDDPLRIYLATQVNGLYKSEDGGETWQTSNGNLSPWPTSVGPMFDVRALKLNPDRSEQLFAVTNGNGILRSDDRALSWTQVHASSDYGSCLIVIAGDPLRLYACLSGVTVSEDGGQTWSTRNAGLESLRVSQLVHDAVSGAIYASTGSGVYVLPDGAQAWQLLDEACPTAATNLAIQQDDGSRYLLVGAEHGVRRHPL